MSAASRKYLDKKMTAPVVAWLIDNGYVADNGGILELTWKGRSHIREAVMQASRILRGQVQVPVPEMRVERSRL